MIRHVFRSVVRYDRWDEFMAAYKVHNSIQSRHGLTYRLFTSVSGPYHEVFEHCDFESREEMDRRYAAADEDPAFRESLARFFTFVLEGQSIDLVLDEHDVAPETI